jgi:epoxide hydrolase 4
MWRHQLANFGQDHLVIAPDLRGYNLSSKPEDLREYGPWFAVQEDIKALVEHLGHEHFVLVGQGWGAATTSA